YLSLTILSFVVALLLFQILDNQIKKYSKSLGILRAIGYNKFQLSLAFYCYEYTYYYWYLCWLFNWLFAIIYIY
ncbi:FtsX-like permease family protein, partial [Streptococcus sp. C300]|uniref:FtsX-like permease family protein n=1 Tax=Streptococcus sp. C300 TaxID=563036 RepID=UPI001E416886